MQREKALLRAQENMARAERAKAQAAVQMVKQEEKAEQLSKSQKRQKAYMEKQRLAAEAGPTN